MTDFTCLKSFDLLKRMTQSCRRQEISTESQQDKLLPYLSKQIKKIQPHPNDIEINKEEK